MKNYVLFLLTCIVGIASCKKDPCDPPKSKKAEILVYKKSVEKERVFFADIKTSKSFSVDTFYIKAINGDCSIDEIPLQLKVSPVVAIGAIRDMRIVLNGDIYSGDIQPSGVVLFYGLHLTLHQGDSVEIIVQAVCHATTDPYLVSFDVITKNIVAEDKDSNPLVSDQKKGTVSSCVTTVQVVSPLVVVMSSTVDGEVDANGNVVAALYRIHLKVTSNGETVYVPKNIWWGYQAEFASAISFIIKKADGGVEINGSTKISFSSADAVLEGEDAWRIDDGTTKHFDLVIRYQSPSTGYFKVALQQFQTYQTANLSGSRILDLTPQESYSTELVLCN